MLCRTGTQSCTSKARALLKKNTNNTKNRSGEKGGSVERRRRCHAITCEDQHATSLYQTLRNYTRRIKMATKKKRTYHQQAAEELVQDMLERAALTKTTTKSGWCLREGLIHVASVDNGRLFDLVKSHGAPDFYRVVSSGETATVEDAITIATSTQPQNSFQSLCRIIAGQQLAGSAARAIWKRLLDTTGNDLTPRTILTLAGDEGKHLETAIRKPAGLSGAKARSILDLAQRFETGDITEEFLADPSSSEEDIRKCLLQVKGLGPWSCDMFILFYLEKPNVFPFGDLGVRKGLAKLFQIKGKGKKGSLCQKKDSDMAVNLVEPYQPYQSLFTYYMWRVADIKDVYDGVGDNAVANSNQTSAAVSEKGDVCSSTPSRKRRTRVVTP